MSAPVPSTSRERSPPAPDDSLGLTALVTPFVALQEGEKMIPEDEIEAFGDVPCQKIIVYEFGGRRRLRPRAKSGWSCIKLSDLCGFELELRMMTDSERCTERVLAYRNPKARTIPKSIPVSLNIFCRVDDQYSAKAVAAQINTLTVLTSVLGQGKEEADIFRVLVDEFRSTMVVGRDDRRPSPSLASASSRSSLSAHNGTANKENEQQVSDGADKENEPHPHETEPRDSDADEEYDQADGSDKENERQQDDSDTDMFDDVETPAPVSLSQIYLDSAKDNGVVANGGANQLGDAVVMVDIQPGTYNVPVVASDGAPLPPSTVMLGSGGGSGEGPKKATPSTSKPVEPASATFKVPTAAGPAKKKQGTSGSQSSDDGGGDGGSGKKLPADKVASDPEDDDDADDGGDVNVNVMLATMQDRTADALVSQLEEEAAEKEAAEAEREAAEARADVEIVEPEDDDPSGASSATPKSKKRKHDDKRSGRTKGLKYVRVMLEPSVDDETEWQMEPEQEAQLRDQLQKTLVDTAVAENISKQIEIRFKYHEHKCESRHKDVTTALKDIKLGLATLERSSNQVKVAAEEIVATHRSDNSLTTMQKTLNLRFTAVRQFVDVYNNKSKRQDLLSLCVRNVKNDENDLIHVHLNKFLWDPSLFGRLHMTMQEDLPYEPRPTHAGGVPFYDLPGCYTTFVSDFLESYYIWQEATKATCLKNNTTFDLKSISSSKRNRLQRHQKSFANDRIAWKKGHLALLWPVAKEGSASGWMFYVDLYWNMKILRHQKLITKEDEVAVMVRKYYIAILVEAKINIQNEERQRTKRGKPRLCKMKPTELDRVQIAEYIALQDSEIAREQSMRTIRFQAGSSKTKKAVAAAAGAAPPVVDIGDEDEIELPPIAAGPSSKK